MDLAPGTVVEERYKILELVKKGGMGAVYRSQDLRLADTICALKFMLPSADLGGDSAIIEYRFNEEMRVLTTLRHLGIPRVLDFFRYGESFCIVMDFIEGQNLEQLAAPSGLAPDFVLQVAEQVLEILLYLHGHHPPVMHRDIKPGNLILEKDTGRVMLVDFGLARSLDTSSPNTQTQAGTLGYAPVEQMQGRPEPVSDLYALGASLHHLMTGTPPRAFSPHPLIEVVPNADPLLANLVDQAVQMLPGDRFASAQAMLQAVRNIRSGLGSPAAPPAAGAVNGGLERILVVDDEQLVRDVLKKVLEREMYQVEVAENGQAGLEKALQTVPDLIISDLDMPGVDGIALCQKLRHHRLTRDIPVLLLTGRGGVEDEARGLEGGAEDYIVKPIIPARLVARVQAALRRRFTRRP